MSRHEQKAKLTGPWRSIHGAIWLIGLVIMIQQGWIWPGILFLFAFSAIFEAVLAMVVPQAVEKTEPPVFPSPVPAPTPPPAPMPETPEHRFELLPSVCPKCGGPIRSHEVQWTGPQSANCPYCGSNLPMEKG